MTISPLISAYLVSVGILLMAAAHAAMLARGSNNPRTAGSFSAICLCFAFFQFFNAMQYSALDQAAALMAHKWVNFFSIAVIPLIALAAESLDTGNRSLRIPLWIAGLSCLAIAYNFITPFGYRFSELAPDQMTTLAWGERIHIIQGQPTLTYRLARFASLCVMVYTMTVTFRLARMGEPLSRRIIGSALAIMGITTALTSLSDSGIVAMPYLGGFGCVFVAGAFSLLIRQEMLNRERQKKRVSRALAKEMKGRHRADARAEQILHHDPLTGLPNRAGLFVRLESLLALNQINSTKVAIFLFDIDRLGAIKGTHGLATSDELLIQASHRLLGRIRDSDVLARTRSDGFALIASHIKTDAGITVLYNKLSSAFEQAFEIAGTRFKISASSGLAVYPDHAGSAADILAAAELALQEARNAGTNQRRVFHPALRKNFREQIDFEEALREALDHQQFLLCYQPQICAMSGRTLAMEALIRWRHPEYGLVSPTRFIPLAESLGLINRIGAWVIETACAQLAQWRAAGHTRLRMAINLSVCQLLDPDLEETLRGAMTRSGLNAADIELEITESALMQDPERAIERLVVLRDLGLRISIDDFGTGYSSLSYLRILPIDAFKLDRSFVDGMENGETNLEICSSAIQLAKKLGLDIVAEGVETEAQAQLLRELGCPILQGYLFARPLNAAAAERHLQRDQHRTAMSAQLAEDNFLPPGANPTSSGC